MEERLERTREDGFFLRFDTFCALKSALEEIFTPSAASVIFSSAANRCGRQSCRDIKAKIKAKENVLAYLSHQKESMNWGKMQFHNVDFQEGTGKITVYDSFETSMQSCPRSNCYFLRGFLAGFLSELFDREICVTEVKCAGKGESCCQFEFE